MNPALLASVTAAAVVVVAVVVAVLVSRATRRRWQAQLDAARADVEALSARLDANLHDRAPAETAPPAAREAVPGPPEFVITSLPEGTVPRDAANGSDLEVAPPAGAQLTAGQFASVAVGESLVRVLSFGYGVRRALSAENRNRIRFEMRREVKHARRQRRRDLKEAKRHLRQVTGESREGAA